MFKDLGTNERGEEGVGVGSNDVVRVLVFIAAFCTLDGISVFVCKFG